MMSEPTIDAGIVSPGEYAPSGERQGANTTFTADQIGAAFGIATERVHAAMAGELGLDANDQIDSRQAQDLAEAILVDQPQAERDAALMRLGAFTPRADHQWGVGEATPGEESDRVAGDDDHVSQH